MKQNVLGGLLIAIIVGVFLVAANWSSSTTKLERDIQKEGESWQAGLQRIHVKALGDDFRKAIEEHVAAQAVGLAILESRSNLYLVSADVAGRTWRMFATIYVVDDRTYWKVEDLSDSNRELLNLLASEKHVDATDPRDETSGAQ